MEIINPVIQIHLSPNLSVKINQVLVTDNKKITQGELTTLFQAD